MIKKLVLAAAIALLSLPAFSLEKIGIEAVCQPESRGELLLDSWGATRLMVGTPGRAGEFIEVWYVPEKQIMFIMVVVGGYRCLALSAGEVDFKPVSGPKL